MRSATVTFLARGDTFTPVKALFVAVIVNVGLKILLMDRYAQVGLALATAAGAWVNLALLIAFAARQKLITIDDRLRKSAVKFAAAGLALAVALFICERPVASLFAGVRLREEATLASLALLGVLVYGGAVLALFGKQWFAAFRGRRAPAAPARPAPREPD
jgi:putative peptidoglycan lipid II flippase